MHFFLNIGALLFCTGLAMLLTKRQAVMWLVGIELMLNAANINLVVFSRIYNPENQIFAIFVMVVAVAEACIILALFLMLYKQYKHTNIDQLNELKH
ncbi:NADH-quinone oxidoreductase subunit K [Thermonema lapsum]|jgi:NADH-quinone oxidoreductase subunit K|uniref:NADH-quinone oxidoreductase subunit K n=1 Tax=Thermonema lapsum TaxID=28195 RepID=A0A846MRA2_9BACT|nr:NADH-quinone oxidoreductase subunit NuoK [Thermonema lapsum]NIK74114.1 NADH-quinone oxidoreductase subunit K [Thermonema lapsum]